MNPPRSLYVHIPFCRHICPYCDFPKLLLSTGYQERYTKALLNEDTRYQDLHFDTIYLGGGTPSALDASLLKLILEELVRRHGTPKEFTIECNPEDVNPRLVSLLKACGINRISLGVQSIKESTLKMLGRRHTPEDAARAIALCREAGIDNLSCDFIYGLPGERMDDLKNDLDWVRKENLPHVSFYALQLEPHTMFAIQKVQPPSDDTLSLYYDTIDTALRSMGLDRYEVSNWARPGFESRHNTCYWRGDPYAAIGYGASSYVDGVRAVRTRSMTDYLAGKYIFSSRAESLAEQEFDYLMCNLRLRDGFSLKDFKERFNKDFLLAYADRIEALRDDLEIDDSRVRVKRDKLYILDSILVDLLDFSSLR